jgi:butyrate response factor 1
MTSSTNHHYNDDNNNNKVVVSRQQSTASSSGYSSSCHRWQSTGDDVDDDNDNDVDRSGGDGRATAAVSRYKTELCRPFDENGSCRYGEKCQFAHGRHELRVVRRHPKYKTDLCRTYHTTGLCPYGPRCHFVHNEDERRRAVQAAAAAGVEKSSSKHAAAAVAQPATAGDRATFEASLQFDQRHKQELALRWALMNGRQQQCEVMSSVDPEHRRRMSSSSSLSSTSPFVDELFETARFQPLVPPQAQRSCFASVDRVGHQQLRQPLAPPPSRNLHRYSFGSLAESPSPPSSFTDSPPPLSPSSLTDDIGLHQQHHRLQHSPPPLPRSHVPCSVSNHDMMTILLLAARLRGLQA